MILVPALRLQSMVVSALQCGEQHVHLYRHTARDRVDAKAHVDAAFAQEVGGLVHGALRLRDRYFTG
jgi:hypothetical protein